MLCGTTRYTKDSVVAYMFKESRMSAHDQTTVDLENKGTTVSLEVLAKMTGFPLELITEEVFKGKANKEEVSLDELRSAMLSYIDSTMLIQEGK